MKEKKSLQNSPKSKNIQKPSTILILVLSLIGFTGVASYKPAPENQQPEKLLASLKVETSELASEELTEDFIKKLEGKPHENLKIESILNYYSNHTFGIDVSHYQSIIDWENLEFIKDSIPVDFVFMRASMGKNAQDKYFTKNWRAAGDKNMLRGAYHYYRPDENSTLQARNFIGKVKLGEGDLPPVLDIEELPKRQSLSSLRLGIKNWLDLVEEHYGVKPIIYTGDTFYQHFLAGHGFDDYTFWIANYNPVPEPTHADWAIWQFSMKGRIAGINHDVDLNVFKGDTSKLKELRITS